MDINENTPIIVHAEDMSVTIGGFHAICVTPEMLAPWPNLRCMSWRPDLGWAPPGHFHGMPEGTHTFNDFSRFAPFIEAWRPHYDAAVKADAEYKAALEKMAENNAKIEAANKEIQDQQQRLVSLTNVLGALGATDHKVLQAMEQFLIEQGKLPVDFGKKRDEWRAMVKAEKKKHGIL